MGILRNSLIACLLIVSQIIGVQLDRTMQQITQQLQILHLRTAPLVLLADVLVLDRA
jgi:hypothetical protein